MDEGVGTLERNQTHWERALNRFRALSGRTNLCLYSPCSQSLSSFQDNRFPKILENLRLQKRGTGGVDTAATGSTFDISNLDRLGKSEVRSSGIRVRRGINLWGLG